jgi:hypothetical protein
VTARPSRGGKQEKNWPFILLTFFAENAFYSFAAILSAFETFLINFLAPEKPLL